MLTAESSKAYVLMVGEIRTDFKVRRTMDSRVQQHVLILAIGLATGSLAMTWNNKKYALESGESVKLGVKARSSADMDPNHDIWVHLKHK